MLSFRQGPLARTTSAGRSLGVRLCTSRSESQLRTGLLPVEFELRRQYKPGERVGVLGSISELSNWDTNAVSVLLQHIAEDPDWIDDDWYHKPREPTWRGEVHLPAGQDIEFKFVLVDEDHGNAFKGWINDAGGPEGLKLKVDVDNVLAVGDVCVRVRPAKVIAYKEETKETKEELLRQSQAAAEKAQECAQSAQRWAQMAAAQRQQRSAAGEGSNEAVLRLPVVFKIKRPFKPGECFGVVGSIPELGMWNTKDVVLLKYVKHYDCWHDYGYGPDGPLWYGKARLPYGQEFEFKFVLLDAENSNAFKGWVDDVVGPEKLKLKVDVMNVLEMGNVCVEAQPACDAEATLEEWYASLAVMEAQDAEEYRKEAAWCQEQLAKLQMAQNE